MYKCKRQLGKLEERYAELNEPLEYGESKQKQLFEKYMGLQFKLTEDKAISLVFTNVNTKDPEQRFVITLDVDEHNQWKGMLDRMQEIKQCAEKNRHNILIVHALVLIFSSPVALSLSLSLLPLFLSGPPHT